MLLKPCPFCGPQTKPYNQPRTVRENYHDYVRCGYCETQVMESDWNNRPDPGTPSTEEIKKLARDAIYKLEQVLAAL